MKRGLAVAGTLLGLVLVGILILGAVAVRKNLSLSTGRCLVADNGSYMLIIGREPIVMSNRSGKETLFAGLDTGDEIRVLHDGVQESYPGGTGAYAVWKLADGSVEDIPSEVRSSLTELGWFGSKIQISDCALPEEGEDTSRKKQTGEDGTTEISVETAGGMEIVEPLPIEYAAQYIRTNPYCEDNDWPSVKVIRSVEELQQYYEDNKGVYDLERKEKVYADTTIGFLDACDQYDADYFAKQCLVMVILEEGSGSIRHEVSAVESTEVNGKDGLIIKIDRKVPEVCTDDMAEWHILVETEPGFAVPESEYIAVYVDDKMIPSLCGYPPVNTLTPEGGIENQPEIPEGPAQTTWTQEKKEPEIVSGSHGNTRLSLEIPTGWEYEIITYQDDNKSFGIDFRPEGETEGYLQFRCHEVWGVCGMGLKQQDIILGQYEASKGTYDGAKAWDFIVIKKELEGKFVVVNYGAKWLGEYMEEAMEILATVSIEAE